MRHHDLIIIGTGSGNTIPSPEFESWDIAIVEDNKFGGTCTNVGCIPTKMFVHPADLAEGARAAGPLGVDAAVEKVHWPAMRDRIFGRIDRIEAGGRKYRKGDRSPNTTVYEGHGRFTGPKTLTIDLHGTDQESGGTETITADKIVIAAGGRPVIPDLPGLAGLPDGLVHTSDTVMRIDDLPARIAVIGGGYVAAEFSHIFAAFGVEVIQIQRGPRLLTHHDRDVADAYTNYASARHDVRLDTTVVSVRAGDGAPVQLELSDGTTVDAEVLLLAVGRQPNGDRLNLSATGLGLDEDGLIPVDEYQRATVGGIFALGDVSSHWQLKHVANHEAKIVAHNLLHPDAPRKADHRYVPAAVFTEPQIASVGLTQQEADEQGVAYVTGRRDYGGIAAGWAREDDTGFLKVLADPVTGMLIGAHVIGPEAATVIQPLIQSMSFGIPAHEAADGQYWIHPALSEIVENALLDLPAPTGSTR